MESKLQQISRPFRPHAVLLMKVGFHGNEDLVSIIKRKQAEEAALGHAYWGYGGTLCHPLRVVQPFAREAAIRGHLVDVLFTVTKSPYVADSIPADQYSSDGLAWSSLPPAARVTASKSALILRNIRSCQNTLPLGSYRVAGGPSARCILKDYFRHRVDKATAFLDLDLLQSQEEETPVTFRADLVAPFAILVRRLPAP